MQRSQIIKAVDDYCAETGLKASTVCQYAVRNRHFYQNLKDGSDYQVGTADRLMRWIEENPAHARGAA